MTEPILRRPEDDPTLERMLQIQRAASDPDRTPRDILTADERREVEQIMLDLATRIEHDIYHLSGAIFLHGQSRSRLDFMSRLGDLGKGKAAADEIRKLLTPNGDAFADD